MQDAITTHKQQTTEVDHSVLQVPPAPKLRPQQAPLDFQSFNIQLAAPDLLSNGNCSTAFYSASNCSVSEALSQNGSTAQQTSQFADLQRDVVSQGSYQHNLPSSNNSWSNSAANMAASNANNGTASIKSASIPQVEPMIEVPSADQISSMSI